MIYHLFYRNRKILEPLFIVSILIFTAWCVLNYNKLLDMLSSIIKLLSPILWSFILVLILDPACIWLERYLGKYIIKKNIKLRRTASILLIAVGLITVFAIVVFHLIPQFILSIPTIISGITEELIPQIYNKINYILKDHQKLSQALQAHTQSLKDKLTGLLPSAEDAVRSIAEIIGTIWDFCLGCIMSLYQLYSKERMLAQTKKLTVALFGDSICRRLYSITVQTVEILKGYISSQIIDSVVVGIICFIFAVAVKLPYSGIISVIIAVTNVIPIFGPFIGAVPCVLLILISAPSKAVLFIIFIVLLQLIDGNIIAPQIIGDKIGISPFWTLAALILLGSIFGLAGMIIGVPIFALALEMIKAWAKSRLKEKGYPTHKDEYSNTIDEILKKKAPPQ